MQRHKKLKARILSLALSAMMVVTNIPTNAFAAREGGILPDADASGVIVSFDELEDRFQPSTGEGASKDVYALNVELDTLEEDLRLPDELTAMVARTTTVSTPSDAEDDVDSGNQPASPSDAKEEVKEEIKDEDVPLAPEPEQDKETVVTTIESESIPVEWNSDKEYKSDENGKFVYTAVLPEGYILADSVKLPQIYVMVGTQARAGGITQRITSLDIGGSTVSDDKLAAEGWKWDSDTSTLTLNGADFNVASGTPIVLRIPATVVLEGTNTITATVSGEALYGTGAVTIDMATGSTTTFSSIKNGIFVDSLMVQGDGELTVVTSSSDTNVAITSLNNSIIKGKSVVHAEATVAGNAAAFDFKDLTIAESAVFTAKGKSIYSGVGTMKGTFTATGKAITCNIGSATGYTSPAYCIPNFFYEDASGTTKAKDIKIATGSAPTGVCAIGNTGYPTLAAAVTAATTGDTIKILENIDLGSDANGVTISNSANFSIDLNGKTLSYSGSGRAIYMTSTGSLTIQDGHSGGGGKLLSSASVAIINSNSATVTISGGTVSSDSGNAINNTGAGSIVIKGGTVSATGSGYDTAISNTAGGSVTVEGGTISAGQGDAISNNNAGTVTVTGGTVSATTGHAIANYKTGIITIGQAAGKTTLITSKITGSNGTIYMAEVPDPASVLLKIEGGTVSNTATTEGYSVYFWPSTVTAGNLSQYYTKAAGATVGKVKPTPASTAVTFSTLTANGTANTTDTTELTLTFDKDVANLAVADITVTGATKGTLTKQTGIGVYKLTISNITVAEGANVNVAVAKTGFTFTPANMNVAVHKAAAFVPVTDITDVSTTAAAGTALSLTGTVAPTTATNKTIVWSVKSAGTTGATISGSTLNTTAAGTVTVTATITNGLTASSNYTKDFTITVNAAKTPSNIAVTTPPTKTAYTVGQTFDKTGMIVTATYTDGTTAAVSGYTFSPTTALATSNTTITISYTENGTTVTTTQAITVTDAPTTHTITASAGTGGSISPSGSVTVNKGENKTFTISANSNYSIASVTVDGVSQGAISTYTFRNVTGNHTISATFSYNGGGGGGSSSGQTIYTSVPPKYTGGTKIIGNVRVPDYTIEGAWKKNANGTWNFYGNGGQAYANIWAPVFNPYADVTKGQSAFDWFKFDANGIMITGWHTDADGNTYYLNPNSDNTLGAMQTGWVLIDGKYYYFNEMPDGTRGKLFRNTRTPDGYLVDENGVWDGIKKQ